MAAVRQCCATEMPGISIFVVFAQQSSYVIEEVVDSSFGLLVSKDIRDDLRKKFLVSRAGPILAQQLDWGQAPDFVER